MRPTTSRPADAIIRKFKLGQRGELTADIIEDALANPTIEVTEEQVRQEYSHVLIDLRNMGLLAALLIAIIVGLNFVI